MKRIGTTKTILAAAALAGIVTGSFTAQARAASSNADRQFTSDAGQVAEKEKGETHDCAGKNSCKGKGGCKSGDGGCAGKNTCKGKGGCGMKDGKPNPPKK